MLETQLIESIDCIANADKDVAVALPEIGYPEPRNRPAGFETFVSTVVSQQLSTKAAATILGRVRALMPELTPESLLALPDKQLRAAGLSARKVEYVKGLAKVITDGEFDPGSLKRMGDDQAASEITRLKGFGIWSAKIYLMFSLDREDVFPEDDLALLVALQHLKGLDGRPKPKEALPLVEAWRPYRTAGSLFLWHYYHHKVRTASTGI